MIFLGREITEQKDYSEKTAEMIDREVDALLSEATNRAKEVIEKHRDKLEILVSALLEKETLEQEELETILG